jgi:heme exporter protein C
MPAMSHPPYRLKAWKYVVAVLVTAVLAAGFLLRIPKIPILEETARNLFFHVPMWMVMSTLFAMGLIYSIRFLAKGDMSFDLKAVSATQAGMLFGVCGLATGSMWARFTWGTWWTFAEPKINMAAMAMTIYVGYLMLRYAIEDPEKRARLSAVYNIFAATTIPFLLYILPRQLPSLHPGADGNPAFSEITAPVLRYVFYPAVIAFIGLGIWVYDLVRRTNALQQNIDSASTNVKP